MVVTYLSSTAEKRDVTSANHLGFEVKPSERWEKSFNFIKKDSNTSGLVKNAFFTEDLQATASVCV